MTKQQQKETQRYAALQKVYAQYQAAGLKLDLTRGKPATEQLRLSDPLDGILAGGYLLEDGTDVRNYGGITGIPEARQLGADLLEVPPENVLAGGNSSLSLMYQYVSYMLHSPWQATPEAPIKFICLVPGYDRHFTICEHFNIEMLAVPLLSTGPDMQQIEALLAADPQIKGIWCVPRYSNPTGHTYNEHTVHRFAQLAGIAGKDFRIFWDNAYAVHHLTEQHPPLAPLMSIAQQSGHQDAVIMFASTSKITFAGAGLAFLAASTSELAAFVSFLGAQMIGFDKVNQLRHVKWLRNLDTIKQHMAQHQRIIKPKFKLVEQKLTAGLGGKNMALWQQPEGGYFISLDTHPGLAKRVVELAGAAGVKLTPAGATFPYGKDPADTNIRIAPTYPSIDELDTAMDVLVTCIEIATLADSLGN